MREKTRVCLTYTHRFQVESLASDALHACVRLEKEEGKKLARSFVLFDHFPLVAYTYLYLKFPTARMSRTDETHHSFNAN